MGRIGLQALVERLELLALPASSLVNVQALLADSVLIDTEIERYVLPRTDRHARQLVHRSQRFIVAVVTWMPGQCTPIHSHAGSLGLLRLVRGRLVEERFTIAPSTRSSALELACDAAIPQHGIELVAAGRTELSLPAAIASVDKQRAIHRLGNPRQHLRDEVAVTLHVYSMPNDSCLLFDQATKVCKRRAMSFDNVAAIA
ncbi:MAG: hypothetical protein EXS02_03135 [Planctomycetes bacterium]|nr:hypothetical protein [Planctomycetota bacterium]